MKAVKSNLGQALDQPGPAVRFYLFHGPDEAQSRALGERLLTGLKAVRFQIAGSSIRSDSALLADEAAAMSLFGGPRAIWVEPAGDEIAAGVEALFAASAAESAVIAIAGALRKSSALLKLAENSPAALAHVSYVPEDHDAERMVADVGRRFGLKLAPAVAARIAEACGNDQAVVTQELSKLALYIDASPQAPKELDHAALDAVGADMSESDLLRLADLALSGELGEAADALARLPTSGAEAIPIIRSLQRRLLLLAPARARVERGETSADVMASLGKSLFWKDKALVAKLLAMWDAKGFATLAERAGKLERELMLSPAPATEALGEELCAIARAARRR